MLFKITSCSYFWQKNWNPDVKWTWWCVCWLKQIWQKENISADLVIWIINKMSRDFTNRVCFIFFSIITFSYRLLNALYVLPWLFGDKSVKSANIILSITILSSTVHARLACPLPSREVATLSSFICAQIFFQYQLNLYRSNFHLIEYVFFQCNIWFTSTTT